jgi:oligopeptide transport system permease protein
MVTSVIYTESTLAYLNLGIQGIDSFGVILSDNQQYISSNSYLILIPSVIMALMMISFNLFGNGLRDAFNPSLKGSE